MRNIGIHSYPARSLLSEPMVTAPRHARSTDVMGLFRYSPKKRVRALLFFRNAAKKHSTCNGKNRLTLTAFGQRRPDLSNGCLHEPLERPVRFQLLGGARFNHSLRILDSIVPNFVAPGLGNGGRYVGQNIINGLTDLVYD